MENRKLTWKQRGELWTRLGLRLALTAAAVWLAAKFGRRALSLCAPFLLALGTAAALDPLVKWMQRALGWNRQLLSALVLFLLFALAGGGLVLLAYGAVGQVVSLARNWSGLLEGVQQGMEGLETLLAQFLAPAPPQVRELAERAGEELFRWLNQAVPDALASLGLEAGERAMGLPSFLVALTIFVMASFLLTADYPYLRSRYIQHLDEGLLPLLSQLRATALGAFGGYLKAELLLSVGVFFILLGGFLLIRQPYGLLLALGLAVLDFIPVLGAGTVMVPWAFWALFAGELAEAAELMAIWGVIALFRRCVEPKFVGDQTGLSPILSLVSIYGGMKLAGVLGMILGPVAVLIFLDASGVF